jgi:hypothetical protein
MLARTPRGLSAVINSVYAQRQSWLIFAAALVPFGFFALPMGLGNAASQPASFVLLLPFLMLGRRGLGPVVPIVLFVVITSACQSFFSREASSFYQFLRFFLPFVFFCSFLAAYRTLSFKFAGAMQVLGSRGMVFLDRFLHAFALLQLIEIVLSAAGVNVMNTTFLSVTQFGRFYAYPLHAQLLVLLYSLVGRRYLLTFLAAAVLLSAGSKILLASTGFIFLVALLCRFNFENVLRYTLVLPLIVPLAIAQKPLAYDRLLSFVTEKRLEDVTRAVEIEYARVAFTSGPDTALFGNGFSKPISPGFRVMDPKWSENSKYEVENAYWALLAKLGIVGCALLLLLISRLPRNAVSVSLVGVLLICSFGTANLFFVNFNGPYLLLAAIIVDYLLTRQRSRTLRPSPTRLFSYSPGIAPGWMRTARVRRLGSFASGSQATGKSQ